MQDKCRFLLIASLLAFALIFCCTSAPALTPGFTITTTNVTMSSSGSSGSGSSSFTLTSVNGYTGSVSVGCDPPTPPTGVTVPYCTNGAPGGGAAVPAQPPITLNANEVVTGTISFYNAPTPCSDPCPVSLPRRGGHGPAAGLALAGVLLWGFGFRLKAARWFTLTLLAMGALAGLVGISACGGNKSVVTPGTYAYIVAARDVNTNATVTAAFNVMVP